MFIFWAVSVEDLVETVGTEKMVRSPDILIVSFQKLGLEQVTGHHPKTRVMDLFEHLVGDAGECPFSVEYRSLCMGLWWC